MFINETQGFAGFRGFDQPKVLGKGLEGAESFDPKGF